MKQFSGHAKRHESVNILHTVLHMHVAAHLIYICITPCAVLVNTRNQHNKNLYIETFFHGSASGQKVYTGLLTDPQT